jgi:hypothetical protein
MVAVLQPEGSRDNPVEFNKGIKTEEKEEKNFLFCQLT